MADVLTKRVEGRDGLRGTVEMPAHAAEVEVRFETGERILVPVHKLTARADGSYFLAMGRGELTGPAAGQSVVVPVVQEVLEVEKRPVEKGGVEVHVVPGMREESVPVSVMQEEVEVERVPINRIVEKAEGVRAEGDVTVIPVYEEVALVEKRLMLREEIRVKRKRLMREVVEHVTLRTEEAHVRRWENTPR